MLELNTFVVFFAKLSNYFKTSYVRVKLMRLMLYQKFKKNFKTSYIRVKPKKIDLSRIFVGISKHHMLELNAPLKNLY